MSAHLPERARLHSTLPGTHADDVDHLPGRLMASWQRSEEYGVSLDAIEPVFSGAYDEQTLFSECGGEVLGALRDNLGSEPISAMLTDADGLVLNRFSGDHALLRSLDAVHLAPGFSYAEREAGTNGLGLALADRVPTVVRAEEHYALSLCTYTCAAVPVLDPRSGRLEGCVNLTTWSKSSTDLLLALAYSAASNTSALMLARSQGQSPRPTPRGQVFRIDTPRLEPGAGTVRELSHAWVDARRRAEQALTAGRVVVAVGEGGSGRSTLLAQALRRLRPGDRILAAAPPAPDDMQRWLDLWLPEVGKAHTAVIVRRVDSLPEWVAHRLRDLFVDLASRGADGQSVSLAFTAERYEDIAAPLAALVETVVPVAPLRERSEDVLPLAHHVATRTRGRDLDITAGAGAALENHGWPGNVAELGDVVRTAALHSDVIELRGLPPELLTGSTRRLSRIESAERDEIVHVLTREDLTMAEAAAELGISRATLYRKLTQFDIRVRAPRG